MFDHFLGLVRKGLKMMHSSKYNLKKKKKHSREDKQYVYWIVRETINIEIIPVRMS